MSHYCSRRFLLPDELRAELPDPHGTGTGDVSEAATADVAGWVTELRVVEYVEEFTPNLERLGFRDRDQFLNSHIGVVDAGTVEESPIGRAKRATLRARDPSRTESAGGRLE
jgi:hypothetical protein